MQLMQEKTSKFIFSPLLCGASRTQGRPADSRRFTKHAESCCHVTHWNTHYVPWTQSLHNQNRTQVVSRQVHIHQHTQWDTHKHTVLIYSWVWSCGGWQDHCWLDWNAADVCCSNNTHTQRESSISGEHTQFDLQLFFLRCQSIPNAHGSIDTPHPHPVLTHNSAQLSLLERCIDFH